ncbi:ABC transporter ATP-binding protein [Paenibacillus wynnii]|uniref:ABC transporter ATP-binding protein n=1 Tax=Paenibacillus wynnii TaxID=268407 RepID=UPI00278EA69B|nr:ABC transporter ATP-binding protein [Paenibacillus wynnii]MDQ0192098.1 ABC-2 type transport system ATP-binding protein [Paenibacillus wynnii]
MTRETVINFENVTKIYKIHKNRPTTLKERVINLLLRRNKMETIEVNVLKNVSYSIYEGETVGIIGRNGAGKSTSLKLIAKIINPDSGKITITGKVSSLLEIGAGFQPDLTGRENVYLYGSILGLPKKYIRDHYEEIVEFSELNDFMNTPVKNYSSGMYMRLAFSVAIHVDPDILLLDEVLAVGDANFQKKCMNKLKEIQSKGKTIVFVSHDMSSVKNLCDRIIYIGDDGEIEFGEPDFLINRYYAQLYGNHASSVIEDGNEIHQNSESLYIAHTSSYYNIKESIWGNREVSLNKFYFSNSEGYVSNVFQYKQDIVLNIELKTNHILQRLVVGIALYDENNNLLSGPNSKNDGVILDEVDHSRFIKVIMKEPPLLNGKFYITLAIYDYDCIEPFIHMEKCFELMVVNERNELGVIGLTCDWLI